MRGRPQREPVPALARDLKRYDNARRRTARSLLAVVASVITLAVFHNPSAWGSGEVAWVLFYAAWASLAMFSITAYLANGKMAEHRGYCLGKYGKSPAELAAGAEQSSDR